MLPSGLDGEYFWQPDHSDSSSSFSQIFSFLTAADGKAPIAAVEEEDDDVPGEC